jgi:hypothetical protein
MTSPHNSARRHVASTLLAQVDHLVYGTPNLTEGIDRMEELVGVRATPGGQHPGLGTRNALIALGPSMYLEIIGPNPEQPKPLEPRWFCIDDLAAPRLVAWAAKASAPEEVAAEASRNGIELGTVSFGARRASDGTMLSWQLTSPRTRTADGLVPFFIDWGSTPHPARTAAAGVSLVDLRAEHPNAERVRASLARLGLTLAVTRGPAPTLVATLDGPRGRVELR